MLFFSAESDSHFDVKVIFELFLAVLDGKELNIFGTEEDVRRSEIGIFKIQLKDLCI